MAAKQSPAPGPSPVPFYSLAAAVAILVALLSAFVVWQVKTADYASGATATLNTAKLVAGKIEN